MAEVLTLGDINGFMINNIEFLKESHIYLIEGIIVPSVTQILKKIFPNKYNNINLKILKEKSIFGTTGHAIIEYLNINNPDIVKKTISSIQNKDLEICIREYVRLCKTFKIEPLEHEKRVSYKYLYAGTLDLIANVDNIESLCDIKFTAELDKEYLSWQLGMYALALGKEFKKYYCVWLPKKQLGQLVEIVPKTKEEILKKLEELGI